MSSEPDSPGHQHGHHGHSHGPATFGRAFFIGTVLNLGFVIVEIGYGLASNSVALLADVLGLLIAWGAATLSKRQPSANYTYGLRRTSILAALINALVLLGATAVIIYEAIVRLWAPQAVLSGTVMAVAGVGILINGATAWLFARGRKGDINVRGAFLHMLADAAVAAGVVVSGFLISRTGWLWLDPATSLVISAIILVGTWGLLRQSVEMALDRVPAEISPGKVYAALAALPGVTRVHDLHIWPMSTTEVALTCHLVMPDGCPGDSFLHDASAMLHDRFEIGHSTIQVEQDEQEACVLAPHNVV